MDFYNHSKENKDAEEEIEEIDDTPEFERWVCINWKRIPDSLIIRIREYNADIKKT